MPSYLHIRIQYEHILSFCNTDSLITSPAITEILPITDYLETIQPRQNAILADLFIGVIIYEYNLSYAIEFFLQTSHIYSIIMQVLLNIIYRSYNRYHAISLYTLRVSLAHLCHENCELLFRPFLIISCLSLLSVNNLFIEIFICCASLGLTSKAASPETSGMLDTLEVMTGQPHAIASRMGIPNPSYKHGYANISAALYNTARSPSGINPVKITSSKISSLSTDLNISLHFHPFFPTITSL